MKTWKMEGSDVNHLLRHLNQITFRRTSQPQNWVIEAEITWRWSCFINLSGAEILCFLKWTWYSIWQFQSCSFVFVSRDKYIWSSVIRIGGASVIAAFKHESFFMLNPICHKLVCLIIFSPKRAHDSFPTTSGLASTGSCCEAKNAKRLEAARMHFCRKDDQVWCLISSRWHLAVWSQLYELF